MLCRNLKIFLYEIEFFLYVIMYSLCITMLQFGANVFATRAQLLIEIFLHNVEKGLFIFTFQ
jgi:hypothetical protein